MIWRHGVLGLGLLALLVGCQGAETAGAQKATAATAATGADDDPTAEEGPGEIGGGVLVGGGTADRGRPLPDVGEFRNPRFGRSGSLR